MMMEELNELQVVAPNPTKHWKAYSTVIGGTFYMMYVGGLYITGNI